MVAGAIAVGGLVYAVQDWREDAERESLRLAAEEIFQQKADTSSASWRKGPLPRNRMWSEAKSKARLERVQMLDSQAKVWVAELTTPYSTTRSGTDPQPDTPYVSSRVFLFEEAGDGWRMVKDLTNQEYGTPLLP